MGAFPLIGPGRWMGQVNARGAVAQFDLLFQPDGSVLGRQAAMGMETDVHGRWMFDPAGNVLTLQVTFLVMGQITAQDFVQMRISGMQGPVVYGFDAVGRQFALQRIG